MILIHEDDLQSYLAVRRVRSDAQVAQTVVRG